MAPDPSHGPMRFGEVGDAIAAAQAASLARLRAVAISVRKNFGAYLPDEVRDALAALEPSDLDE